MIVPHIVFILSYAAYVIALVKNGGTAVYPVYLAPPAIYALLAASAAGLKALKGNTFYTRFKNCSWALLVFVFLFFSAVVSKLNFPDPHNFLQRKFEILLGASYALFIIVLAGIFIKEFMQGATGRMKDTKNMGAAIALFFFIFYFSLSLWFNYANQPTGDEPSYMLVAHSIIYDRDLDLKNNFDNRDYGRFYDKELTPQGTDIIRGGRIFSYHPVMLSVLIAPFYFIAGRLGVTILMNAACAALIAYIFLFLFRLTGGIKSSLAAAAITGFTMPVLGFSNNISNEILITLIMLFAYYTVKYENRRPWITSAVLSLSIWMHIRSLPVYAALCLIFVYYNRKDLRQIIAFTAMQAVSVSLFLVFNYVVLGSFLPSYAEGGASNITRFGFANIPSGMLAFFMDRQIGLFAYAPVYIFILSGAVFLFRKHRKEFMEMSLIFIPYFILITSWRDWGGGSSSPRYLIQVIFVLSACLAVFFENIKSRAALLLTRACLALSLLISTAIACVPWFRWDKPHLENPIVTVASKLTHIDLGAIFPSFYLGGNTAILAVIWAVVILAANYFAAGKIKLK
jgi:hypothetical protein